MSFYEHLNNNVQNDRNTLSDSPIFRLIAIGTTYERYLLAGSTLVRIVPFISKFTNDCIYNVKKYNIVVNNNIDLNCSICFEEYKINDSIKILNCGHHYCSTCIDNWYPNNSCPYCRQIISDNNIFNSGLVTLYLTNNKLGELLLKIINNYRKQFNYNIIDKNYLIKIDRLETITNNKNKINRYYINLIFSYIYKINFLPKLHIFQYKKEYILTKKYNMNKLKLNMYLILTNFIRIYNKQINKLQLK